VNLEERLEFQEHLLASIDRNLGSLVEAQQQTDRRVEAVVPLVERVEALAGQMHELAGGMTQLATTMTNMVNSVGSLVSSLGLLTNGVNTQAEGMNKLAQAFERNLSLLNDMIRIMDQFAAHQEMAEPWQDRLAGRQRRSENRIARLVKDLDELLDWQRQPQPGS